MPHLRASDPPRHAMALSMKALTFTPSHANSRHGYCRGNVTTSNRCPPCLGRSLPAPMRLHHSIDDGENGGGSPGNGDGYAVWCDGIGRTVTHQSQQACPTMASFSLRQCRVCLEQPARRVTGDVHPHGPLPARLDRRVHHTPGPARAPRCAAKRPRQEPA